MANFYTTNYFFIKRLHSLTGIIPIGAFFLVHMLLNSRAAQSPDAYQWVPDTLGQVPFILFIEIGLILLPILFHGILGLVIIFKMDMNAHKPALSWYENWAYVLQRITGVLLLVLIVIHVATTWGVKLTQHAKGQHFDVFGLMQGYFQNGLMIALYLLFVLVAAYHFGNGIYNFLYKWGATTHRLSQKWAIAGGLLIAVLGIVMGLTSLWGLTLSDHAQNLINTAGH